MKEHTARSLKALHDGAFKALKKAVTKAIAEHESAGVPVAIWRDGRVVRLSGRQLRERHGR